MSSPTLRSVSTTTRSPQNPGPCNEAGVRAVLTKDLAPGWSVTKKGKSVAPGVTFYPDLILNDGAVVGDVKYKLVGDKWIRSDLNQIIAFGTAFEAQKALVIGFSNMAATVPCDLVVGPLPIRYLVWNVDETTTPESARSALVRDLQTWLEFDELTSGSQFELSALGP